MRLREKILQWRKRRAISRHDHAAYFRIVNRLAKLAAAKLVEQKLNQNKN
jgi:hypothetical protein